MLKVHTPKVRKIIYCTAGALLSLLFLLLDPWPFARLKTAGSSCAALTLSILPSRYRPRFMFEPATGVHNLLGQISESVPGVDETKPRLPDALH